MLAETLPAQISWRAYWELCKPRVVALMLMTVLAGMLLAARWVIPWPVLVFGLIGIGLAAGAGATLNHVLDRRIDAMMERTKERPLPSGQVSVVQACVFAAVVGGIGLVLLVVFVNLLTAVLTFCTLIGYALIYTVFLKRATPQNIVIGGLAGAMPPLLGWTAVTGQITYQPLLLVLIIFTWTPPHFWALAIYRQEEYARAKIPMLTVTHGIRFTKISILLYTLLLTSITLLPFAVGMSGLIYLIGAVLLDLGFLYRAVQMLMTEDKTPAIKTFYYSLVYLLMLFVFLLIDHYCPLYNMT